MFCGCVSDPGPADALQFEAERVALQRGAVELQCPTATAQILSKHRIREAPGADWSEHTHRAAYTIDVAGCEKRRSYSVACDDDRQTICSASPLGSAPRQLADQLQPGDIGVTLPRQTKAAAKR
jgi:hypothetical protein